MYLNIIRNDVRDQNVLEEHLKHADCILEPFPFGGLNSTYDALSVNQLVVSLPSNFLSGRFTYGLYKKINFKYYL